MNGELSYVRCFANEIEPIYVATILERWHVMTGRTPAVLEWDTNTQMPGSGLRGAEVVA